MTEHLSQADPFGKIADEFVAEYRQGRRPSIEEYAARYPDCAEQIREILPALVLMEKVKTFEESDVEEFADAEYDAAMIGRELGDYRIVREVGRGGMGIVYEAEQISLGRRVALKVLPQQFLADARQRTRFAREAKAAARLHHTNIVPVFGIGSQDGMSYYVMQFIHGLGLDDVLEELKILHAAQGERSGAAGQLSTARRNAASAEQVARSLLSGEFQKPPGLDSDEALPDDSAESNPSDSQASPAAGLVSDAFSMSSSSVSSLVGGDSSDSGASGKAYWRSVARIGEQVADALQYAHDQGVTHRDIKPSNLLLDLRSTVWVTDFGLAKADDQQNITHTGDILGTLRYMPPEAFEGRSDARSDVYSLGLTLYELMTLQPAFEDSDRRQLIKKVTDGAPLPIPRISPDVPRDLATIVHKSIEREPAHRYQSARELHEDLRRFLNDEPILARRASPVERLLRWSRRNRGLSASLTGIAALLIVIAVGASLAAAYFRKQETIQRGLYEQTDRLAARNQTLLDEKSDALATALETGRELDVSRQLTVQNLYYAQMVLAHEVLDQHRGLARTQSLLEQWRPAAGEPDLRGWEWYYINALCHREQFALAGHTDTVTGVNWSPDGRRVASASRDGTVRVWDVAARGEEQILDATFQQAFCVAWDSTGARLAAGGDDGVMVWDVDGGDVLLHAARARDVYGVAWNVDDTRLGAALKREQELPGQVHVFDTENWEDWRLLNQTSIGVYNATISWNPTGILLAIPAGNNVAIWHLEQGVRLRRLEGHSAAVQAVAFNPGGQGYLASASRDATIRVWDLINNTVVTELQGHTHGVASIAWHPDANRLASAAWDGTARIWDWSERREIARFSAHPRHCFAIAWNPTGTMLATAGDDNLIKFWDVRRSQQTLEFAASDQSGISDLCFSPDGALCSASTAGELALWDPASGERRQMITESTGRPAAVSFNPDGTCVASVNRDDRVRLWDAESGEFIRELQGPVPSLRRVDWSVDGTRLAAAGASGPIIVWNVESGEIATILGDELSAATCLAWSPDGRLASADATGAVRAWNIQSETAQLLRGHSEIVNALAWDSRGLRLASGAGDHQVRIWNVATGETERVLVGHNEDVSAVAWGPHDQRLLSADVRGTLILWDPQSGQETLNLRGDIGQLADACWSRDGRRIAATCNGRILIWDATRGFEAEEDTGGVLPPATRELPASQVPLNRSR